MTWFAEEKRFDGTWVPVTFTSRPSEKAAEGAAPKRRSITEVPEHLRHLTLDQMREIFGQDGRFRHTGGN